MSFAADLDAKVDGLFGHVGRAPKRKASGAVDTVRVATVPRPLAIARPGLIDLSQAPSSMEERAKSWGGR